MATVDAIVVGSGPNGLTGANILADKGWSVLVLESQPTPGGAVRSDRDVHPDFVHDTFSAFYPLALGSPAIRNLHLEDHGLRWCRSPAVVGVPKPTGGWALQYDDAIDTAHHLDDPADADTYRDLVETWRTV